MRILIVEDETKVSSFVARGLTAERFAVDVAADGEAGLELATTYAYDLIILDLMLPRKDGLQFRAEQLADGRLAEIPVIAYSGDARLAEAATALRVRHWFRKPIDFGVMLEVIGRYCPEG